MFYKIKRLCKKIKFYVFHFFLLDMLRGLWITGRAIFKKKITVQFPENNIPVSPRFRGMLALRRYPNGEERCIACRLCESICPSLAITIEAKIQKDGTRKATKYEIDMFKCISCGLCEEACPVDSVVVTPIRHYFFTKKGQNFFTKEQLLDIGDLMEKKIIYNRKIDKNYYY
ncbi:NADH-quinone oxidoreductase subunit I [Candidatus Legionella polyplacis]|uniref:NADH-quinone oxidoreductase subunit I n=1 Tax=Candidatus Legionella polyplacis TaxID=2005262 RepID=A0ABZ2GZF2_9GAMM|nr:NADH-quinone oxidoreductase subunit NuoI [Candidatus Legionella polyplacis]ATW01801.1 NADH-quinone oxidoreductase subunit I [Candidatus Legionella polyplacis]